jgi:hypothetical protein
LAGGFLDVALSRSKELVGLGFHEVLAGVLLIPQGTLSSRENAAV